MKSDFCFAANHYSFENLYVIILLKLQGPPYPYFTTARWPNWRNYQY